MNRYAVMGNPVAHSKSPRIHSLFAAQTGQEIEYSAILVEPDGFEAAVAGFRASGGNGLNVTVPFKQEAWELSDQRSERAQRAGAANTLLLASSGEIYGDNTDGAGLVRDLVLNHGVSLAGKRLLLVGAGGAARGVVEPLLNEQPALLVIANRTPEKAVSLARNFCDLGYTEGCGLNDLEGQQFNVIINATAASLADEVPALPESIVTSDSCCYDMMYADEPTAFMNWAAKLGANKSVDGLGMLVEQAAESFYLWRGVRPDTTAVIRELRQRG